MGRIWLWARKAIAASAILLTLYVGIPQIPAVNPWWRAWLGPWIGTPRMTEPVVIVGLLLILAVSLVMIGMDLSRWLRSRVPAEMTPAPAAAPQPVPVTKGVRMPRDMTVSEVIDRIWQVYGWQQQDAIERAIRVVVAHAADGNFAVRGKRKHSQVMETIPRDYWRSAELKPTDVLYRAERDVETWPKRGLGISTIVPVYRELVVEREQIDKLWPKPAGS